MTLVVTMSATTAAYAAQAVKPSARVSGDGPTDEAITLLSARPKDDAVNTHAAVAALRSPTSLSLMLMNSQGRLPQGTPYEAVRRYQEFELDEPESTGDSPEQGADEDEKRDDDQPDWIPRLPSRDDTISD
ncbi:MULTISPECIES: hypothetical protein [unclassified Rhizobium]|uniref:hypothetical protein n=1 Tax=unclassified Rhizobium TaxID=2613769 RepID=UPI00071597F3|nr:MULTISPECIES: hypothetical protein [unclassified Rhizobium]KQS98250.1 hypothetical protein ASG50_24110 [Rhizobium sp. Leaf386]KQT00515.1 hypothetical protein ASG42_06700 [Rhizobium sp. Leaf391]KQT97516.1 hypothetical protein ASG68_11430 [Rhizobium sp. Leaf453]